MVLPLSLLLLALQPAVDPQEAADNDRQRLIGALMAEDRWAEAAEEAEAVLASGRAPTPDFAIVAGNLRMRAGHHAHAWRHFNNFGQTPDLPPDSRTIVAARLAQISPSTRLVAVQLSPAVAGIKLVARRLDARPPPDMDIPLVDGKATVRLDTGTWLLLVTAPNHATLRHIVSRDITGPLALTLEPRPAPAPPPQKSPPPPPTKPRVPPTSIAGGVLLPLGLAALAGTFAVLPAHGRIADRFDAKRDDLATRPCNSADQAEFRSLTATSRQQEHLMIGLGATAGVLLTAGAVLLARGARERRRQIHLETTRGAVLLGLSGHF